MILATPDPTEAFANIDRSLLFQACGFIPGWVCDPGYFDLPLKDALELQYGFGPLFEVEGAEITPDGVMLYCGDPPFPPLMRIQRGRETFYQYQNAFIAIVQPDGSSFTTRMD